MNLSVHWVSNRLVEVQTDDSDSGVLNSEEAIQLARNLIEVANELLSVDSDK